jgi:RND superfamily putative drug exporter
MSRLLNRWGRFAARRPWTVIGVWLVLSVGVVLGSATAGRTMQDSFDVPGLDSQAAIELLATTGSDNAGITAQVVATPRADGATFTGSTVASAQLAQVRTALAAMAHVVGATQSVSPDGRVGLIRLQYPTAESLSTADLDTLKRVVADERDRTSLRLESGGELYFTFEESGAAAGELVGVVAAMIILLLAFGSIVAMGLPIGLSLFGLALGISSLSLINLVFDIPSWAPQVASMIALGVGIDYALFLVTRHREFLALGLSVPEAAGRALATAGQAVLFAGGTVVIAVLGMAFAGIPFMTAAGVATSAIVLVMVLASLTLLPAFLGLAGQRINRRGHRGVVAIDDHAVSRRWMRWGTHVSRHSWAYLIGTTAVLLALTAPVLSMRLGFPDEGALPPSRSERAAYDLVAQGFGPGINGPLVVVVDTAGDADVLTPLRRAIAADPGVASVTEPAVITGTHVATMLAFPATAPQDAATVATIARLRDSAFPQALAGTTAQAHIGGQTASWADIGQKVRDRLPLFIGAVILMSFLLLMLVFRSVLVPLKAAAMTLLSLGAAYGVIVAVFQRGWGMDLIGLQSTVPVIPFIPMFMFAVLFGLSMDYEVFLLSRVREEYVRTGDSDAAVIRGIASSARVITSAALIMICVFMGFVFDDDPASKMLGLGLATAVLVDATIVRMVLVPATMHLLGRANWWLPGWLDRLLPTVDVDGAVHLPPAGADDAPTSDASTEGDSGELAASLVR